MKLCVAAVVLGVVSGFTVSWARFRRRDEYDEGRAWVAFLVVGWATRPAAGGVEGG